MRATSYRLVKIPPLQERIWYQNLNPFKILTHDTAGEQSHYWYGQDGIVTAAMVLVLILGVR